MAKKSSPFKPYVTSSNLVTITPLSSFAFLFTPSYYSSSLLAKEITVKIVNYGGKIQAKYYLYFSSLLFQINLKERLEEKVSLSPKRH